MARLILEVVMCSFEWRSYTLKCTRSFLNISQFSLNNKQWSEKKSASYFYIFNGRETLHGFSVLFSIMVNSGHGHTDCCCRDHHCLSCPPHAGCLLRPWFLWWKSSNPLLSDFFLPFLPSAVLSHFSAGACGAALLPAQFTCLPSKRTLLTHALLPASLTLTALCVFSCRVLTASQLALVWLCDTYTHNIMLV